MKEKTSEILETSEVFTIKIEIAANSGHVLINLPLPHIKLNLTLSTVWIYERPTFISVMAVQIVFCCHCGTSAE
jgi:hypothetical protein